MNKLLSKVPYVRDPFFWLVLSAGLVGMFFSPISRPAVWLLVAGAFAEEVLFRATAQDWLEGRLRFRLGPVTAANVVVSVLFAVVHLFAHPPVWALAVFFPSLVFGLLWTRYKSILACALTHLTYNLLYFYG